jgi:hypothetical protein
MTGMSLPGAGMALAVDEFEGLAELGDRSGLAGTGQAGQDQAAAAGVGVAVEVGQPASLGDDLADDRGRDDQEPGVVVEPGLVVSQPPGLVLVGTGVGIVLGQLIQFILAAVSMNEVGSASGVMEASQQLSTSLGVAVLGTIFFALFKHHPATDALRITSWACLVPLAAAFTFVFLLPKPAREEEGH